jgi:hypothetical protein
LVNYLLSKVPNMSAELVALTTVYEMNDGGMGSVRFVDNADTSRYLKALITAEYIDADNVQVFITLNVNTAGKLFELDIFKGDFSPLNEYPKPHELKSIACF